MNTSSPAIERTRLAALSSYRILDTLPEEEYDAITQIASQICQTPVSLITLLDDQRQWFKSAHGVTVRQTPRHQAFCNYAIKHPDQVMKVPDARLDERFAQNPLTTGEPHVIFYAGVPLVDTEGHALGTLCVIDHQPRELSDQQETSLKGLARQVVSLLQLRRSQFLLEVANQQFQALNQQLHESNQVLQTVVDNCPAGLVLWEAVRERGHIVDFRYRFTNPANAILTGLSVETMTGSTLKKLFPSAGRSGLFERLVRVVESGQRQEYEQFEQFDQISIWGKFSIIPYGDGVLFTIQDISRLKQTEEKLRAHSENLTQLVADRTAEIRQLSALQNAILQYAGLAIVSTDAQGIIRTVNPATEKLLGYTADELIGRADPAAVHDPATLRQKAQALSQELGRPVDATFDVFRLRLNIQVDEYVLLHKDGRRIPVLLTTTPLHDETGVTTGYVGLLTDISSLKTAQEALRIKNQELNTFFAVAPDLHCIADADGNVLKMNPSWLAATGYTTTELADLNYFDLVHPDDRAFTEAAVGAIRPGHPIRGQINRFRRKDGTYRIVEWNVVRIENLLYASARDITERQQAERQLKNLNQRLQLATRVAGQGIWAYTFATDQLVWDERMYEIHGIQPGPNPVTYQDFLQLIHPEDRPEFLRRSEQTEDNTMRNHARIVRPDGQVCHTETRYIIVRNKAGIPFQVLGVAWDVTEQKQAELALAQSEERYRRLVNNLKEVVFQSDTNGNWTFLNPSWTQLIGYTVAESLGQPFYNYLTPSDQFGKYRGFKELIASGRVSTRHVLQYQHKNGEYRWAEVFAQLLFDEVGQPMGTSGTITDITEQRQALTALRESEQRFREFAENIDDVFWIHSANPLQLLYVNPAFERLWGFPAKQYHRDPYTLLKAVAEDDKPKVMAATEGYLRGEEIALTYRIHRPDGEVRWVSSRTFVMRSETGEPLRYIGITTDITGQKEQEVILHQSLQREQELNRLKTQFVSTASHEFRTPLATIQSSVDLIRFYLTQPEIAAMGSIQRHLTVIEKEIAGFSELLADILTIGTIEAGKITFNPQLTDILALSADVVATHFSDRKDNRRVRVSVDGAPRPVYVDDTLMTHVLVNLLSNAFKFSDEDPDLRIGFEERHLVLTVVDRGIGIPADDLPHLFETFFRARNATTIQGSGLGLIITRQFVERHGGTISVASEEHAGTTFVVTLPDGLAD